MYGAFASIAFQSQFAYRNQVWAGLFGRFIQVFAWIAIWMSVYGNSASVDGIARQEMIAYAVIAGTVLTIWDWEQMFYAISTAIRKGDVAVYLLKPVSYPLYLLATEVGNLAFELLWIALPVVVVVALVYGIVPPAGPVATLQFVLFWVLSFFIMFAMSAALGLLAFWLMTAFSLAWFMRALLSFMSGTFVPFWFFPEGLADVLKHLPFAWVAFHPMAAYLGKMSLEEGWFYLGGGVLWLCVLTAATLWLWRQAATRLVVQGG